MKLCLLLKPPLLKQGKVGSLITALEASGVRLCDTQCAELTPEDLYEFFSLQVKYPSQAEVESYTGGMALILGFDTWVDLSRLTKLQGLYFSASEEVGEVDCSFWFGG